MRFCEKISLEVNEFGYLAYKLCTLRPYILECMMPHRYNWIISYSSTVSSFTHFIHAIADIVVGFRTRISGCVRVYAQQNAAIKAHLRTVRHGESERCVIISSQRWQRRLLRQTALPVRSGGTITLAWLLLLRQVLSNSLSFQVTNLQSYVGGNTCTAWTNERQWVFWQRDAHLFKCGTDISHALCAGFADKGSLRLLRIKDVHTTIRISPMWPNLFFSSKPILQSILAGENSFASKIMHYQQCIRSPTDLV